MICFCYIAMGVAAGFAAYQGIESLSAWRIEMVGRRKAELGEEVLSGFYQAVDHIQVIRLRRQLSSVVSFRALETISEADTMGGGISVGQARIIVDQPPECTLDDREGRRCLHERADCRTDVEKLPGAKKDMGIAVAIRLDPCKTSVVHMYWRSTSAQCFRTFPNILSTPLRAPRQISCITPNRTLSPIG